MNIDPEFTPAGDGTTRKLRMLCLHGYHGSGSILRRQLAPLTAAIGASTESVFVDAPSLARGDFGWWHLGFRGWESTRDWAVELLRRGPRFDGVFGFSQGAALTGLLAAVCENSDIRMPFDFAIMVGGFTSTEPRHADLFRRPLTIPSVHVMGRADTIVPLPDSRVLADRFVDPLVLEHAGGHIIPGDRAVTGAIANFLSGISRATDRGPVQSAQ
ncbi:hypothetical protein ACIP5Y_37065 [Nocardia sp. NPDC088792]|uniref:hypothetical protein n=1 Tax=Nocardia sp. NPDC088792 TaxID=3364332 RepID=UPI0037F5ADB8